MSSAGHGPGFPPYAGALQHWLHDMYDKNGVLVSPTALFVAFGVSLILLLLMVPRQVLLGLEMVVFLSPIWLPLLTGHFAWQTWLDARRFEHIITKHKYILLEIKMPRETRKTPLAMELFFNNMHLGPSESTWYKRIVLGNVRPWWSLEIVSLGGQVHFFIWTRDSYRRAIESFLYAQYPGIEVVEAVDYSRTIDPTHPPYKMFALEYKQDKEGPYPIKTYIDFGFDKMPVPKPEEQSDPLGQIIELMGSLGPGEQMWLQMMIRQHKDTSYGKKDYSWKEEAREIIERIRNEMRGKVSQIDQTTGKVVELPGFPNPTKGQVEAMAAIERNVSKPGFDVGMRGVYFGPEDKVQGSTNGLLMYIFKPVNSETLNSIKPTHWSVAYNDFPWEDIGGHHYAHAMHTVLDIYRRRAFFHYPYKGDTMMVMSSEELATIFHVPSSGVKTPSLPRIQSTTGEAPSNLPT